MAVSGIEVSGYKGTKNAARAGNSALAQRASSIGNTSSDIHKSVKSPTAFVVSEDLAGSELYSQVLQDVGFATIRFDGSLEALIWATRENANLTILVGEAGFDF